MTRAALVLAIAPLLVASAIPYQRPIAGHGCARRPLDAYEVAEALTGAPAAILRGIARAESAERDDATGDGGESVGRFQLREVYRAERVAKWGEYDPRDPREAAIIAGRIYMEALAALGSEDLAIAAHRQGITGVRENGPTAWYIERVRRYGQ